MIKIDILLKSTAIVFMVVVMCMSMPAALSQTLPCMIAGTVTVNGVPTAGVTVSAPDAYQTYTTESDGSYYISVPANGQMTQITATYNGISVTSDPFQATVSSYQLDIPITYEVATPTPTPTDSASANETATPTASPSTNATATPTATPTPTPTQAPAAPAQSPPIVYVTVTVTATPEPTESPNMTISEMLNVSDINTATPMPPAAIRTQSPGFAGALALACLAGAAIVMSRRKER